MSCRNISIEQYSPKIYFFEYFISIFTAAVLFTEISTIYLILLFFALLTLKYHLEGLRANTPIILLSTITCLLGLTIITLLLCAISIYTTYILIVYNIPHPTTTLSYKAVTQNNNLFTLFYPTNMSKNKSTISLFGDDVGKRMFDIINKDPGKPSKVPQIFVKMMIHYYTKLSIGNVIQSAPCIQKEYEPIIISHQLGVNSLYSLARQFVDSGYLVMLVDHPQQIRNIHPDADNPINKTFRKSQLKERYQAAVKALDFILDDVKVSDLLGDNVRIKKDRVHIMGHSFGGSTALYTAINDRRITGSVISLDPCFFILEDSYTLNYQPLQFPNNTLILLAEDYYQKHYKFFQNDYRAKIFRKNSQNVRILRMLGANHANYSELSLFTAGQFHRLNVVRNSNMRLYFEMSLALSHQILKNENLKDQDQLVNLLIEQNPKYRKQIQQTFRSILKEEYNREIE